MSQTLKEKWKYKRWILLCFIVVLITTLLTYKIGHMYKSSWKENKLANYLNTSDTIVKNTSHMFTYSNDIIYSAIIEARERNCVNISQNRRMCDLYKICNMHGPKPRVKLDLLNKNKLNVTNFGDNGYTGSKAADDKHDTGMCARRYPRAIIIGVHKSGTRELIDFLAMNPGVVIKREPEYEVSYFDKYADKGNDWYKSQMPYSLTDQLTIEKSPSYFTSQQTPRRLHTFNPGLKLLLIIRDPVDRTISQLTFVKDMIKKQYENNAFNCLFRYNTLRNTTTLNKNCFAVKESIYDEPMKRYLKYFPLEQIHIVDAAKFRQNPCRVLKRAEQFLGLKHFIQCQDFVYNDIKKTYCIRNVTSGNCAACYSETRGRKTQKYTDIREQLRQFFKPHNDRFFKLIHREFSWT